MAYRFNGDVIRLDDRDYAIWKSLFKHIDLDHELRRLDADFRHEGSPKKWFVIASARLNYLDKKAKAKRIYGF